MDANFVSLTLLKLHDMPFGALEEQVIKAARDYQTVLQKASSLAGDAPEGLLSGTPKSVYLKTLGHRALTTEDAENIINALGSQSEKQLITDFHQAQETINSLLRDNTKNMQYVLKRANVPYKQAYERFKRSDLWKPEQIIQIMEVIRRLQQEEDRIYIEAVTSEKDQLALWDEVGNMANPVDAKEEFFLIRKKKPME